MLERYDGLLRTHGIFFRLSGGDPYVRLTGTVPFAVAAYLVQDVEQGFLLRAVGEVGAAGVEVPDRARPIEGDDRRLGDALLVVPQPQKLYEIAPRVAEEREG